MSGFPLPPAPSAKALRSSANSWIILGCRRPHAMPVTTETQFSLQLHGLQAVSSTACSWRMDFIRIIFCKEDPRSCGPVRDDVDAKWHSCLYCMQRSSWICPTRANKCALIPPVSPAMLAVSMNCSSWTLHCSPRDSGWEACRISLLVASGGDHQRVTPRVFRILDKGTAA